MFNVADFWPSPKGGEVISFQYDGPKALRSDFSQSVGVLLCDDYQDGQWHDQWQIIKHPSRGVLEVGDMEVLDGWEAVVWGARKQITYRPFKEIVWGHYQNIGDVIQGPIEIDRTHTTGAGALFPNAGLYGYQVVSFEDQYDDILQMNYAQWWGNKVTPGGARYWMKRGVGPIAIAWRMPDGTHTSPIYASVT